MRKTKFLKKVTAIALALGMLTIPNLALAATKMPTADTTGVEVQPRWTYLRLCQCGLDVVDGPNKIISILFSTDTYENGAGVEAEMEWYNPTKSRWQEVPDMTWNGYTTTRRYYDIEENDVQVPYSGKYRALVTFYAVDSTGKIIESTTDYTNVITVS